MVKATEDTADSTSTVDPIEEIILNAIQEYDFFQYDPHQRGGRTRCTPELTLQMATLVAKGATKKDAATLCGIGGTHHAWNKRGRDEYERLRERGMEDEDYRHARKKERPYLAFFYAMEKAVPLRKITLIDRIRKAGEDPRNWQANAWLLERIHPDEFGRKTRIDVKHIDWRDEVIDFIEQGGDSEHEYNMIVEAVGEDEARKLFKRAGARVPEDTPSGESEK